tara:strand:- start:628 stop:948 length:321 start_codon:yes stop_codon:yes gene_type:complete
MMNLLNKKIELYLGRKPDFIDEVQVVDDGKGNLSIDVWNAKDKAKPTDEQLNTFTDEATKLVNNNKIRATRKNLYGDIGDQLDEIFKDIDAWKTRIQKIKTDNPKE